MPIYPTQKYRIQWAIPEQDHFHFYSVMCYSVSVIRELTKTLVIAGKERIQAHCIVQEKQNSTPIWTKIYPNE